MTGGINNDVSKKEAITKEISRWHSQMTKYETVLSQYVEESTSFTDQIAVLNALNEILPEGNSKELNKEECKELKAKESESNRNIIKLEEKIEHCQEMLRALNKHG